MVIPQQLSIAIALAEAVEQKRIKENDLVLLAALEVDLLGEVIVIRW